MKISEIEKRELVDKERGKSSVIYGVDLYEMKENDFFSITFEDEPKDEQKKIRISVAAKLSCFCHRHNPTWKFATRWIENGIGVWRIK